MGELGEDGGYLVVTVKRDAADIWWEEEVSVAVPESRGTGQDHRLPCLRVPPGRNKKEP